MSKVHIHKPCKQRFKGVENFLRRVAFNLGNSPSQTEVKIISCIPIDVTDLQSKILFLERQLEETCKRRSNLELQEPSKSPRNLPVQVSYLSQNTSSNTNDIKLSCENNCAVGDIGGGSNVCAVDKRNESIITNKETNINETAVYEKPNISNTGGAIVNTVLYAKQSNAVGFSSDKSTAIASSVKPRNKTKHGSGTSGRKKTNLSFLLSAINRTGKEEHLGKRHHEYFDPDSVERKLAKAERRLAEAELYHLKCKKKRKISKEKGKIKPQLVYFAQQMQNNPFNKAIPSLISFKPLNNSTISISHAYLDDVIRKQYDSKFAIQEFSDTSHYSQPVCRETSKNFACSHSYESDVCSCCHGRFQNVDNFMSKDYDFINEITQRGTNHANKAYYDSNLYDVVPEKDTTNRLEEVDFSKIGIEIKCWPEQFRSKFRHSRTKNPSERLQCQNFNKYNAKSQLCNKEPERNKIYETNKMNPYTGCRYMNRYDTYSSAKVKIASKPIHKIELKNESIETEDFNTKKVLNNQSTQLEVISDVNKRDSTLNEIKSILQSFLAEVKTNTKLNDCTEKILQRDVIVQKGSSQNNLHDQSTLLHCFTYNNSYNGNPYLSSCSRQVSAANYCLAGVPHQPSLKYLQNFPVFFQPSSGRRLCTCYYKNSVQKSSRHKHSTAAATNTEGEKPCDREKSAGSTETEKLIKEIYKSMVAPLEFPTKDNSVSESDDVKSTKKKCIKEETTKTVSSAIIATVSKRDVEVEVLSPSKVTNHSKTNSISTQLDKTETPVVCSGIICTSNEAVNSKTLHTLEQNSSEIITLDDEESDAAFTDDTEEEDTDENNDFIAPNKHEKKSLLRRIINSVKMFKKRREVDKIRKESEPISEESDLEYETIYSGKTAPRPRVHRQGYRHDNYLQGKPDRNMFIKKSHENTIKAPYLEQEYRRRWNEHLMFDKGQENKHSSEQIFSTPSPKNPRPMYWNTYEARSVDIENKLRSPLKRESIRAINYDAAKDKSQWFKKNRISNCGEQWKKFILEN